MGGCLTFYSEEDLENKDIEKAWEFDNHGDFALNSDLQRKQTEPKQVTKRRVKNLPKSGETSDNGIHMSKDDQLFEDKFNNTRKVASFSSKVIDSVSSMEDGMGSSGKTFKKPKPKPKSFILLFLQKIRIEGNIKNFMKSLITKKYVDTQEYNSKFNLRRCCKMFLYHMLWF